MDKNEFSKILNFDNEINGIGDEFWRIAQSYWWFGYLDVCTVYRIIADVYTDTEEVEDEDCPHSWIDIYEINSDIIIKILEYKLFISDERKDWIKEGLDSSYYKKMYYFLHYEERTPSDTTYSFFLNEIFTELNQAIKYASRSILDYDGYNVEVAFDTNDKAFEYLELFNEDKLLYDNDLLVMKEIFSLYKGKNGSEIFKLLQEKQKMKEMISDLEDEEIKTQVKINNLNEKTNNLNSTIIEIDEKIKLLQDLIKDLNKNKETILLEKIVLEQDTIGLIKDITNIKNQKIEISYKIDDILIRKKLLEDDND
ncbi:hypothetical protein [Turicibacter sanguinis]|uniref:hypothetical protein n=1 Tax=Turicibacter sanguinis TaxID=154288 RepID=UPI00189E591B|nr:hypothetical protein [Turicibacter sanguinis]